MWLPNLYNKSPVFAPVIDNTQRGFFFFFESPSYTYIGKILKNTVVKKIV